MPASERARVIDAATASRVSKERTWTKTHPELPILAGIRSILPVDILMPLTLSSPWKSRRAARAPHLRAS